MKRKIPPMKSKWLEKTGFPVAILGIFTSITGYLFFDTYMGVLMTPAIYLLFAKEIKNYLIEKRRKSIRNEFMDLLYSLAGSFTAGRQMHAGIKEAIPYLKSIYGESTWLINKLKEIDIKLTNSPKSDVIYWEELAEESGIEDIKDFVEVYKACRGTGGNIIYAVDRGAEIISKKISVENEIRTLVSQKMLEWRMIGVMPIIMLFFLKLTSPGYLYVMYETVQGRMLMAVALAGTISAIWMIERITRLKV